MKLKERKMKEMVSVQRATIELSMHLGYLPSTQEARAAIASCDSYATFVLSNLPRAFKTRELYVANLPFLK